MNDFGMELYAGGDCFNRVISRILLFYYGEVIRCPFIYFYFHFRGSIYIRKRRNSIQHMSLAKVILCDFSLSIQIEWEFPRYGQQEKSRTIDSFILFYLNWKWKGLATFIGHSRSLTAACMGGELAFSRFPPLWEEESWQLQLYRCSHRR